MHRVISLQSIYRVSHTQQSTLCMIAVSVEMLSLQRKSQLVQACASKYASFVTVLPDADTKLKHSNVLKSGKGGS